MSILLSTTFAAGIDENFKLNPLKLLSCIRFLAVESFTPLLKTSRASRPAPQKIPDFLLHLPILEQSE
jgi:hypothetical protein